MTDAFWQRPKRNVSQTDYVWYDHAPLGSSTLTKIMQRISLQAGLSDNYTNYSIRSACIPLVEAVCEEALRKENGGVAPTSNSVPTVDIIKPSGPVMSHSTSEELSSDDGLSQASDMQAAKDFELNGGSVRVKPPGISSSVGSGSMDADDTDIYGLMQAKTQVLDLIRGLMVKDIQKFVDWLKTVRVQYSAGELIVLCSPVDKSNVEPIPDDITVDRNRIPSRNGTPDPTFKKSGSLDLSEKRQKLKKESSVKEDVLGDKPDLHELTGTTIKQVDFNTVAGMHCSSEELGPMKISIPTHDTLLMTGIPENLQLMLHKKRGPNGHREALASRVFCSENEMDVAEVVAVMGTHNKKARQRNGHAVNNHVVGSNGISSPYQVIDYHQVKHQTTVLHRSPQPVMVTIPAAHTPIMSTLSAREHFKDNRNKSMGCLDTPPLLPEGVSLKRVSSTGTPVLKRQAHVIEQCGMYPENLTVKRPRDDNIQATNLSMKPLKKTESQEAKRARADRLADSLRYHQEILQNSPLIKRPGERNFSGFRHCYANTIGNSVKPEPLDTSYS